MKYRSAIGLLLALMLVGGTALGQVSIGGEPESFSKSLPASIDTKLMPLVDVDQLMQEDAMEAKDVPPRFGYPFDVNYSLENSGSWETLPNGDRIWRLRIISEGAYSINLLYDKYDLPKGATLYLYSADKSYVLGGFGAHNNKASGQFATGLVKGDVCIVEYYEPADVDYAGQVSISRVVHAYRNLFDRAAKGFGDSGSCNNNVNCPETGRWADQVRSVALIINGGGSRMCTGSMVNNVRQDLTPYFLTANHCLDGTHASWLIVFNYESPTCADIDGPLTETVSGATLLASYSTSDFGLLELSAQPPDSYNVFYNGWSALDVVVDSMVGIHHPSGDIKKISWDYDPSASTAYLGDPGSGDDHWRVSQWDDGTTEPGSSGSPLYDPDQRVIGQLHGGYASCTDLRGDWYGKIATSWEGGGTSSTRLRDWLDPDNTGALFLDGRNQQGVSITHTPLEDTQDTLNPYDVVALILATAAPLDPSSLVMAYDAGAGYVSQTMTTTGNPDEYSAQIPAQSPGTVIDYYVAAADTDGEVDTAGVFTFRVSDYGATLLPESATLTGAVDDTVWYALTVTNVGIFDDDFSLTTSGNLWGTKIYDATGMTQISATGTLVSNQSLDLQVAVVVPSSFFGDADTVDIIASSTASPGMSATSTLITVSAGEPIAIPFFDDFPTTTIDMGKWVSNVNCESNDAGTAEPSPSYSLNLDGDPAGADTLMSQAIDLDGLTDIAVKYYFQQTGGGDSPEAGDDLFVEYLNQSSTWVLINQHLGADPDMSTYQEVVYFVPPDAYHSGFRLRFRNTATSGAFDDWFVDNVSVDVSFPPEIDVTPISISETLQPGDSATADIIITNLGLGSLNYSASVVPVLKRNDLFESLQFMGQLEPSRRDYPEEYSTMAPAKGMTDQRIGYEVEKNAGGPDAYGYFWIDSDEAGGPTFSYTDISGSGVDVAGSLSDDSWTGPIDLGFDFPFYGDFYSEIYIGSNGIIGFDTTNMRSLTNATIPTGATPNNIVAWFWDDLNPADASASATLHVDTTGGKCVVQYTGYPEYQSGGGGDKINGQIILDPDGTITLLYLSIDAGFATNEATIGIENSDGSDGLEVNFNSAYIHDSLAIQFFAPYQWLEMAGGSGLLTTGQSDTLTLTFRTEELEGGSYLANVVISSNDPDENPVTVPVDLTVTSDPIYICGDVNGDTNGPDISDLTYVVNYLFLSGPPPPVLDAANVDGNPAGPDIGDVTYLVRYLFQSGPALQCP